MGFLSKVFKGVKKVFKKVGKAIKSGLKSVGKFMDKIGIVGQIGLSLLLPGIGSALSGMWGSLVGGMQAYSGLGSTIINGAGNFLNAATQVASRAGRAFSSITEGVKNVVGETLKLGAKKLGLGQVASNIGTKFGSQYFTDLGASISNASFDSIGQAFNLSKKEFLSSFSGDAFLPDSAYEAARNKAMMTPEQREFISGVQNFEMTPEIESQRLKEMENVQGMYEEQAFDAEYNPNLSQEQLAALRGEPLPALTASQESFMAAREQGLADLPSVGEQQQSLLGRAYDETVSRGRQLISDAPQMAYSAAEKGIESSVVTGVRRLTGVEQAPEYETTYYGTYVPQLDFSNTAIATPSAEFNPVQFASTNTQLMNMYPFGATAQLYNDATYATQMRQYGYA
jgi:hypothetical protein